MAQCVKRNPAMDPKNPLCPAIFNERRILSFFMFLILFFSFLHTFWHCLTTLPWSPSNLFGRGHFRATRYSSVATERQQTTTVSRKKNPIPPKKMFWPSLCFRIGVVRSSDILTTIILWWKPRKIALTDLGISCAVLFSVPLISLVVLLDVNRAVDSSLSTFSRINLISCERVCRLAETDS